MTPGGQGCAACRVHDVSPDALRCQSNDGASVNPKLACGRYLDQVIGNTPPVAIARHRGRCGMTRSLLLMFAFVVVACVARAQSLDVTDRATSKTFTAAQLLADKAARDIEIADPVYKRTMTYRVIAMVDLLRNLNAGSDDYVQARAVDDFSVAIPTALLKEDAFLAIETAATLWPKLPAG